jgi:hypothetical protein
VTSAPAYRSAREAVAEPASAHTTEARLTRHEQDVRVCVRVCRKPVVRVRVWRFFHRLFPGVGWAVTNEAPHGE